MFPATVVRMFHAKSQFGLAAHMGRHTGLLWLGYRGAITKIAAARVGYSGPPAAFFLFHVPYNPQKCAKGRFRVQIGLITAVFWYPFGVGP